MIWAMFVKLILKKIYFVKLILIEFIFLSLDLYILSTNVIVGYYSYP